MPPLPFGVLARALMSSYSSGGGGGIPAPSLDQDLTTTLPPNITFARAGGRTAIIAGAPTTLATGVPAFESWNGRSRGLAVEPGHTNLFLHSNDFSQSAWEKALVTVGAGDAGSGLITSLSQIESTDSSGFHHVSQPLPNRNAGERVTISAFCKIPAGAVNWSVTVKMSKLYGNIGSQVYFRLDGSPGSTALYDPTMISDVTYRMDKLAGDTFRLVMTGTWVTTSWKEIWIGIGRNEQQNIIGFTATTAHKYQIWGANAIVGNNVGGHVTTGAATASQAPETASYNDAHLWLTTGQGTFIIEHDCESGTILGSGTNVVLSATRPGITAFAWSGSTSDKVTNGGAVTTGVNPTFSGFDLRLLATSLAGNHGHIKSVKFTTERLTVEQMQTLTSRVAASSASPGSYRGISVDNYLPREYHFATGTALWHSFRLRAKTFNRISEVYVDFPNITFPGVDNTNAMRCEGYALELNGVTVPVKKSGALTFDIPIGAAMTCRSDSLFPADFGLSEFPEDAVFYQRGDLSVTTAGHKMPIGITGAFAQYAGAYDPAATTISSVYNTGNRSVVSGANTGFMTYTYAGVLIGKFTSGDPKTAFLIGDSIAGGTTPGAAIAGGSHYKQACEAAKIPLITFALGGSNQQQMTTTNWHPYLSLARIFIDEMGTNNGNGWIVWFQYYYAARVTYGYGWIIKGGILPRSNSGTFSDEASQLNAQPYPAINWAEGTFAQLERFGSADLAPNGWVDQYIDFKSVRGVDQSKWLTNGTPRYTTIDGLHPSDGGYALLTAELTPILAAIKLT